MAESVHPHEVDEDEETSSVDEGSVSLLSGLAAYQSRVSTALKVVFAAAGAADATEDVAANNPGLPVTDEEMKENKQPEPRRQKKSRRTLSGRKRSASKSRSGVLLQGDMQDCGPRGLELGTPGWVRGVYRATSTRAAVPTSRYLHKVNGKGETRLHGACQRGDLANVKMLIQAGVCVNALDNAGWTALHEASVVGNEEVVEELLKAGATVNVSSHDGVTPLVDAVIAGSYQVVKLLLQSGANPNERGISGVSALEMAEEENIKDLLETFQASSAKAPAEGSEQPGAASSGPGWFEQHPCWSLSHGCGDATILQIKDAGGGGGATEPTGVQMGSRDPAPKQSSHSDATTAVLGDVRRKQTELSTWPLKDLRVAGRYHAALMEIQNELRDVLTQQRLEKDSLVQKYWKLPGPLRRVLKAQIVSLASRQSNLIDILQKQMLLERAYVTAKVKSLTLASNHQGSAVASFQLDHDYLVPAEASSKHGETGGCHPDREETGRLAGQAGTPVQKKTAPTRRRLQKSKARSRPSVPQPGTSAHHVNFKMTGKNALIQTRAGDSRGHLCRLVRQGALAPGSALQLLWKNKQRRALVLPDGSVTSKGKSHRALEDWLESILGKNIPVSSEFALEKVTFRDKPLSYYLLNMEAKKKAPRARTKGPVKRGRADATQKDLIPEPGSLDHLLKFKTVHLVEDDELVPNAVMDYYWDKFLKEDSSESEDWGSEL